MNDVVSTIYDILGIKPPRVVNGVPQDPFDGVSFANTFNDPKAEEVKSTHYFEVMGSRAIYRNGWMASAFGPRIPWVPGLPEGIKEWTPDKDRWELYDLNKDWSQANDLAGNMPARVADMKDLFLIEFTENKGRHPRASGCRLMSRRQDSSPRTSALAGLVLLVAQTASALSDPQSPRA